MNRPIKVLVIDDEEDIQRVFQFFLKEQGFAVTAAANGQEGLESFGRDPADVVLTDLRMPVMDGMGFIKAMKVQSPETPIVVISGAGSLQDAIEAIRQGAWDYVVKPVEQACELGVVVRRNWERARLQSENRHHREHLEQLVEERTREIRTLNAELEQRVARRTIQLEAANRELEAFDYSVSHDLRTPLRAIDGFALLLTEHVADRIDAEGKRLLGVIRGQAQRMGQLIDDLLRFSQLGRQPLQSAAIDMTAMAKTVFEESAAQIQGRKPQLRLDPLPPALSDSSMIRQIWVNLLSNAIKYTARKEVAVIEVSGRTEGNERWYCVRDNGAGFDMKYAGHLFGVFQRLHQASEFEGTGVGLALVQRILHRHGGRIRAEAKVNEGAAFHFTLPARPEVMEQPRDPRPPC